MAGNHFVRRRGGDLKRPEGEDHRTPQWYREKAKLTVLGIPPGGGSFTINNKAERPYWVVDTSRTKVYQYDAQTVYVPFDKVQQDLDMDAKDGEPARASEIDIRIKPAYDLNATREKIEQACNNAAFAGGSGRDTLVRSNGAYEVMTWEASNKVWLHAIENEKVLVLFLFGLISIVAVFLIFCIFYMIVVEKTRDIGIIKSVGATSTGVAGIFLGYGLVIGIVGSATGLLLAYLIVHNINAIHTWLGHEHNWLGFKFAMVIWDPQVYAFDTIPNRMDAMETSVIVAVAILSAVLGALIPAIRAARLNPVEALRWE